MPKHTSKQIFALVGIYLMISITVFSSVSLGYISQAKVYGKDNINGFRAGLQDNTQFFAYGTSNMSIDTITRGRINMTCTPPDRNGWINCTQPLGPEDKSGGLLNFIIVENTVNPLSQNLSLIIDDQAPNITLDYTRDISGQLIINYTITDTAYPGSLNCSGIKSLTIKAGRDYPFAINGTPNVCSKSGTLNFSITNIRQDNLTVTARAEDNVGNPGTANLFISGDFTAPLITENFDLMIGNRIVDAISGNDVMVSVRVQIDDVNLNRNAVFGNLSSFTTNPALREAYKNLPASCEVDPDGTTTYDCTFNNIQLHTTNPTLTVGITATDTNWMKSQENITKTFKLQNSAGQLLFIGPEPEQCTPDKSICYTRSGSHSFLAEFDATSNYSLNGVRLRYDDSSNSAISFCRFETTWKCYSFHDVTGDVRVSIAYTSSDDYGNMVPTGEKIVYVDNTAPNITGNITASTTCPVAGESLELDFKVKEDQSPELKFVVNTSEFTTHDTQVGTCEALNEEDWDCHIEIKDFDPDAKVVDADITISDLAGNKADINGHGLVNRDINGVQKPSFEICKGQEGAAPNLIKEITTPTVLSIDRKTASIMSVKSLVQLNVVKKNPSDRTIEIIDYPAVTCNGVDSERRDITGSGHYVLVKGANPSLVVFIGREGVQLPATEFTVNCTISMRVRKGTTLYTEPELDIVKIKVKPYNNPMGTIDDGVKAKITLQKEALREIDDSIKTRKTINNVLGTICTMVNIVTKINGVLQTIKSIVYVISLGLSSVPITKAAGIALWEAAYGFTFFDYITQTTFWPTSFIGIVTSTAMKIGCNIYTCQFYKANGLYDMVSDVSQYVTQVGREKVQDQFAADNPGHQVGYKDGDTSIVDGVEHSRGEDIPDPSNPGKTLEVWTAKDPVTGELISQYTLSHDSKITVTQASPQYKLASLFQKYEGDVGIGARNSGIVYTPEGIYDLNGNDPTNPELVSPTEARTRINARLQTAQNNLDSRFGPPLTDEQRKLYQSQVDSLNNALASLPEETAPATTMTVTNSIGNQNTHLGPLPAATRKTFDQLKAAGLIAPEMEGLQLPEITDTEGGKWTLDSKTGDYVQTSSGRPVDVSTSLITKDKPTSTVVMSTGKRYGNSKENDGKFYDYYTSADGKKYKIPVTFDKKTDKYKYGTPVELSNFDYVNWNTVTTNNPINGNLLKFTNTNGQYDSNYISINGNNYPQYVDSNGRYIKNGETRIYIDENANSFYTITGTNKISVKPTVVSGTVNFVETNNNLFGTTLPTRTGYLGNIYKRSPINVVTETYNLYRNRDNSFSLYYYYPGPGENDDTPVVKGSLEDVNTFISNRGLTKGTIKVISPVSSQLSDNRDYISGRVIDVTGMADQTSAATPPPATTTPYSQGYNERNMKFYSELESSDWIINPYRSVHYDGLCSPAVLYNKQKERQIRCKYLSCMEDQITKGLPPIECEKEYEMNNCLYIDSAQWHVEEEDMWHIIGEGMLRSGLSLLTGLATTWAYTWVCGDYVVAAGVKEHVLPEAGLKSVSCGLAGAALQWSQIMQVFSLEGWENVFKSDIPNLDNPNPNYCDGVDYSE